MTATGDNFSAKHSPLVEYYVLGNAQALDPDASPLGWIVNFFRCDLEGVSGPQNYSAAGNLRNGDQSAVAVDNGWLTCTNSNYQLAFTSPPENLTRPGSPTQTLSLPFQVEFPAFPTNSSTFYDGWGLLAWMTQLAVEGSGGVALPTTPPTCQAWVPSIDDCGGSPSGWFAVLLSQNGAWLDSFPSSSNNTTWSVPNVIVSSQDRLLVVLPASWPVQSETLGVFPTPSAPALSGSSAL